AIARCVQGTRRDLLRRIRNTATTTEVATTAIVAPAMSTPVASKKGVVPNACASAYTWPLSLGAYTMLSATTGEPRIYSAGVGSNLHSWVPVVALREYTVPWAVFVEDTRWPDASVRDDWTGPFGVKLHFRDPEAPESATTRPGLPNAPPP